MGLGRERPKLRRRERGVFFVERGDDLEVGHEGAQLCRGAEIKLRTFIDVEGLIEVVGLDAQTVGTGGSLVEGEGVHDARRIPTPQQMKFAEPRRLDPVGVSQVL